MGVTTDRPYPELANEDVAALDRTWAPPPGFVGWLSQVNHRAIGLRYIVTAFLFFLLAGADALRIRLQLAFPESAWLGPDTYAAAFTMHGTTMMFLFALPMVEGIGIYFAPLMVGARDMPMPRLNAFGYWVYLIAGTTLYIGFFFGAAPAAGAAPTASSPVATSTAAQIDVLRTTILLVGSRTARCVLPPCGPGRPASSPLRCSSGATGMALQDRSSAAGMPRIIRASDASRGVSTLRLGE
jgi:hypothetical protein